MPAFLLSPIARWLIGATVVVLGVFLFIAHERSVGAANELAKEKAATAAEHDRRMQVEQWAQGWSAGAIAHVNDLDARLKAMQAEVAKGSARHDKEPGLSLDAVERLRRIGQ